MGRVSSSFQLLCQLLRLTEHTNLFFISTVDMSIYSKQREEYKKMTKKKSSQLDKYRIDKLNEIGFQWSLASYTVVSWDDRFEVSLSHLGLSL